MNTPPSEVVADALPELLPCPFCGSPASLYRATRAIHAHVTCSSEACEACGPALYSPEAAIEMWNKRATTPAASEGVEERARELLLNGRPEIDVIGSPYDWMSDATVVSLTDALAAIAAALRTPAALPASLAGDTAQQASP